MMSKTIQFYRAVTALFATFIMLASAFMPIPARAASIGASLSCFVNAMGGVEFGAKLFTGMTVKKAANGDYTATLHFTDDATLVIYTVNAHIFVNADKSPVGFYDAAGKLHTTKTTSAVHTDQSTVPENLKDAETFPEDGGERLNVFDKILAIFRGIINFFKNLFKK